jgi:hypothetical protein
LKLPAKETFVVAEEFQVGKKIGDRMLSAIGWNFFEHFLNVTKNHVRENADSRLDPIVHGRRQMDS